MSFVLRLCVCAVVVSLLSGCSGDSVENTPPNSPEAQTNATEPIPSEALSQDQTNSLDLRFITDDFSAALVLHPSRILNSDFNRELEKNGVAILKGIEIGLSMSGIDPRTVEQMILLADKSSTSDLMSLMQRGVGFGEPPPRNPVPKQQSDNDPGENNTPGQNKTVPFQSAIVRFTSAVNEETFYSKLRLPNSRISEVDGLPVRLMTLPNLELAMHFVDDRTLVATDSSRLKKMVETRSAESSLIEELRQMDAAHDLILCMDLTPVQSALKKYKDLLASNFSQEYRVLTDLLVDSNVLTLTAGVTGPTLMSLSLIAESAENIDPAQKLLEEKLTDLKENYQQQLVSMVENSSIPQPEQSAALELAIDLRNNIEISSQGNRLKVTVPKPENFEILPQMLKPAVYDAGKAGELLAKKNKLKHIGLALHNYQDMYGKFPGANCDFDGQSKGLSWRVHVLPFLEGAELYQQFHLDEPWDSEHNKTLISKMPDVFKTPEVPAIGKTAFQVFVGEQMAFNNDQGLKIGTFWDGFSNIGFVIEAGPELSEIWTKPGGLTFNDDEPMKALGAPYSYGFLFLMGDVNVTEFTVDFLSNGNLKKILTRNGRELIEFPPTKRRAKPPEIKDESPTPDVDLSDKKDQLRQIGIALHNYHDLNGRFPSESTDH